MGSEVYLPTSLASVVKDNMSYKWFLCWWQAGSDHLKIRQSFLEKSRGI